MQTRTSTRTNTVLYHDRRTRQKSQERPKAINKRSAPTKSTSIKATPPKSRKLSHSNAAAPRRLSADLPAKSLASALKRRQESITSGGEASPTVVVPPARKSPAKVRFSGQHSTQGTPVSSRGQDQGYTQPSGNTVQVVVPTPSIVNGSRDKPSKDPQQTVQTLAEEEDEDESAIATTQIERPETSIPNPNADFTTRLKEIKSLAWTWVQNYFSDVNPEAKNSLDLLRLARTSPELMEYANWISCCGQKRTWEGVFNEQRAQLVFCILGKMLEVHVFGHEMFGADKDQLRELRELDMELVNKDGFYRQRCRAHRILAFLPDSNAPTPNFHHSLTAVHASFIELVSPLLPSPLPPQLQPQLLTILLKAATLSLLMRRQGKVVYHWATHPAVGSLFESDTMHILNECELYEEDNWRRNTDVEVVTMAGWPSCVAYRPCAADDVRGENNQRGKRAEFGANTIGRAEVCVTFGSAIKPLSDEPENWLGKRLRVEMMARDKAKRANDRNAVIAKRAGLGVAGFGITVSAMMGLKYVVENCGVLDEVTGYLGSFDASRNGIRHFFHQST